MLRIQLRTKRPNLISSGVMRRSPPYVVPSGVKRRFTASSIFPNSSNNIGQELDLTQNMFFFLLMHAHSFQNQAYRKFQDSNVTNQSSETQ